jgi:glycosyltransferase involved in cell wall biosynthesis
VLDRVREWDYAAARRVTHYVANSQTTRRRIQDFYGRDSAVIHPPVDVDRFSIGEPEDYALMVTEIVRHKRIEIALEAARRAGQRIKVVGTGPDLGDLRQRFGDSAEFLGRVPDDQLDRLYMGARVFVMTNVEEFGIAAVEAQAAGRPVLAAAAGGALETVVPGKTGVLVAEDDVTAFAEALRYTAFDRFDPMAASRNAARFSTATFKARLRAEVDRAAGLEVVADAPLLAAA